MFDSIRSTLHPSIYHGRGKRPPFFEGWYYKQLSADTTQRYAIIPGIFLSRDPAQQHVFVQILNGQTGKATYHRYPMDTFRTARSRFEIHIGPNRFWETGLSLNIDDDQRFARGELNFQGIRPWPVSLKSPGIMGWYAWAPFMETYHGVVSLDHAVNGSLYIDHQPVDFNGGRGYIEKDWGKSFPSAWVWMQSNHFSTTGTSLTASIATIPWLGRSFAGFIIGLLHDHQLISFATYNGSKLEKFEIREEVVSWVIRNKDYRLEIRGMREPGGAIFAPTKVDMGRRINETMRASIDINLFKLEESGPQLVLADTGDCAGLEVAGDLDRLVRMAEAALAPLPKIAVP